MGIPEHRRLPADVKKSCFLGFSALGERSRMSAREQMVPEEDSFFFRKPLKLLAYDTRDRPLYQPCTNGREV